MVKESLVKFDSKPLFPPRIAYTAPYKLSAIESELYQETTNYVRHEFARADALANDKRAGTVGFALTILQRRLASSPEAIFQSIRRRRERLQKQLKDLKQGLISNTQVLDLEDLEDLEDAPDQELEQAEQAVLDHATTASTAEELKAEIATLGHLEDLAQRVRRSGEDCKWRELRELLSEVFTRAALTERVGEEERPYGAGPIARPVGSPNQKLVIFTEFRDTLTYLQGRVQILLGRAEAVVVIHGGLNRQERTKAQDAFKFDDQVRVLIATDAAGEGINLQRAHLMVNYDLPWNPNRLEQRFGRIHRIGQQEVCHLWNLVADQTREGDVYIRLLSKLELARQALGGQVFDVLGKLQFEGKPLRDLLIEAIRYGERPEVKAHLEKTIAEAVDQNHLRELLEEKALAHDSMDASRVARVREDMERAEARRLQPHYIESFFLEAFAQLGGQVVQREARRYKVNHVPAGIRNRDRIIGVGEVRRDYERVTFDKTLVSVAGQPLAAFLCPGHPLLDATLDLTLERHRELLKRGTVLVDERDSGEATRVLFYLEHALCDGGYDKSGQQRVISRRLLYVELDAEGTCRHLHYAPYLDYRPLKTSEPSPNEWLERPELQWVTNQLEKTAMGYAISSVVPEHLEEVRKGRLEWIGKTRVAVRDRLLKEISYWDHRAEELHSQEQAGKPNARLNSMEARRRADDLQARMKHRLEQLDQEAKVSALPPVVLGGVVVIPAGLLTKPGLPGAVESDNLAAAARAREIIMQVERGLGFHPIDRELEKVGYDIESRDPESGRLRFIEVKGRRTDAETITVTRNEILTALNKPDDFILAIVEFLPGPAHAVHYVRQPFRREADFGACSVNYSMKDLLSRAQPPG